MLGFRYAGLWLFLVFFTRACVCVLLVRAWIGRKGKEQEERIFWTGRRAGRQTEEEDNLGGSSRGEEAEGLIMPHPCRKGACGEKGNATSSPGMGRSMFSSGPGENMRHMMNGVAHSRAPRILQYNIVR